MQRQCADGVMSIAVLHHISSVPRRLHFLEEMARILKPGGLGLVTVWASQQEEKKLAKWERIPAGEADLSHPPPSPFLLAIVPLAAKSGAQGQNSAEGA